MCTFRLAAKPQRAVRLVVRAEEAAAAAPKPQVGPKRGSTVSFAKRRRADQNATCSAGQPDQTRKTST